MDKRTLLGLLLIGCILFGFAWYNNRQAAEYQREKARQDSIAAANRPQIDTTTQQQTPELASLDPSQPADVTADQEQALEQHMGHDLYLASRGEEQFYVVENDLAKFKFSSRGGRVATVELKDYTTYKGAPLLLFEESSSLFDLSFFIKQLYNTYQINTSDYYFTPADAADLTFAAGEEEKVFVMRLPIDSTASVEFRYTIPRDNYMIGFDVAFVGMQDKLAQNQGDMELTWHAVSYQNEKGFDNENRYTTIAYRYPGDASPERLGESKDAKGERVNAKINWVAFKDQFFSSILIAPDNFQNGEVGFRTFPPGDDRLKSYSAKLAVPFSANQPEYKFNFYFGPNKYSVMKKYDLQFERLIPLGGWIVGWVNRWLVIPVFDTLNKFINSFGLIILILTILVKLLIMPLTYKSYISSAKMRLLKPEMDALAEKYPKQEDAMKKQQATMALYKSAGVSPMGGCLPMLIQMPIFIALFRFFPASIELRGESFLWAEDLSAYDSILDLPFNIPMYGDHISLFTLLMAVSMFFYSQFNFKQTAAAGSQQMPGMKFMMVYLMPVMMLVFFNNFASGLTYYYFLSNLFTILQTFIFRFAINEDKLRLKMKENAKKPQKKSKFQERYDAAMKAQQQQAKRRR